MILTAGGFLQIYLEASTRSISKAPWTLSICVRLPGQPGPAVPEVIHRSDVQDQEVAEAGLQAGQTEAAAGEHASARRCQDHLGAQAVRAAPDRLVVQRDGDATISSASQHPLCCALHRSHLGSSTGHVRHTTLHQNLLGNRTSRSRPDNTHPHDAGMQLL